MKLPVVSTTSAAEGIGVEFGKHLFVEDKPKEFANKVLEMLKNKTLRDKTGENAYEFVKANYDWESNLRVIDRMLDDVVV